MELADGALADPILEVVGLLRDFLLVGGLLDGCLGTVVLILDGCWLGRIASLGFRVAGVVFANGATLDVECLWVREFDFNVLLSDTGEFAV